MSIKVPYQEDQKPVINRYLLSQFALFSSKIIRVVFTFFCLLEDAGLNGRGDRELLKIDVCHTYQSSEREYPII